MNDSDNLNTIDNLEMFNTMLNIMFVFNGAEQRSTLTRIEQKLDILLERKNDGITSRKS